MLRSKDFSKGTAYTGILSNGLDLIHVFVALFAPGAGGDPPVNWWYILSVLVRPTGPGPG